MFSRSTTNRCKFQVIAAVCENEGIAFKPLNEVLWLSCHFALQFIIKNYDSLIAYFEKMKSNDPISKYSFKKLKNNGIHIPLEVLNDVFEELAVLCKSFQRQGLTPIDAQNFAHAKINKLRKKYLRDTTFWSERVDNLLARISEEETSTFNTEGLLDFIRLLCDYMVEIPRRRSARLGSIRLCCIKISLKSLCLKLLASTKLKLCGLNINLFCQNKI